MDPAAVKNTADHSIVISIFDMKQLFYDSDRKSSTKRRLNMIRASFSTTACCRFPDPQIRHMPPHRRNLCSSLYDQEDTRGRPESVDSTPLESSTAEVARNRYAFIVWIRRTRRHCFS